MSYAYLQFGKAGEPMRTLNVDVRRDGQGEKRNSKRISSEFQIKYSGKWRRVYRTEFGPAWAPYPARHFALIDGQEVRVTIRN